MIVNVFVWSARMRLAWFLVMLGCYHPNIADGTIYCSKDMPPRCPDGLSCASDGLCYRNPPTRLAYGSGQFGDHNLMGMAGVMLLHTDTGVITIETPGQPAFMLTNPAPSPVPLFAQTNGPDVTIWSFKRLIVPPEITIRVSPDSRAVPVLTGVGDSTIMGPTLKISGPIDLAGSGGRNGGPAQSGTGGPVSTGAGGGGAMADASAGGGGGGNFAKGAPGTGTGAGSGGDAAPGGPNLITFGPGGGGGSGGSGSNDGGTVSTDVPGYGGSGGGAMGLLGFNVDLEGSIDLSGEAGASATSGNAGGGGGGAGGTILIIGDTLTFGSTLVITVNGGAGGNGIGTGGNGGNGSPGRIRLLGTIMGGGQYVPGASKTQDGTPLRLFPQ
jgi:hypothetical protein